MMQSITRAPNPVTALCLSTMLAVPVLPGLSHGAGFQISEVSVSGLGRAFAGAGVANDDLSDMFYNPAALGMGSERGFQLGATVIDSKSEFSGNAIPFGGPAADGGETSLVPNLFYAFPDAGAIRYGIGITAPFGLATDYPDDWAGRYQGLHSELATIDINPALSYRISDTVSVGAGISMQYADAELSQASFLGAGVPDGKSTVTGDNWGFGFNLGAVFTPASGTRIGAGYRSSIDQEVEGDLSVVSPAGDQLLATGARAEVTLPETVYLGLAQELGDGLELMASARWTRWSRFEELRITLENGLPDAVTPENWDDTLTLSLGFGYRLNQSWTLRAGYSHDESPVPDEFRTVRIPDTDRDWFTLGASFHAASGMIVDFGYAHLTGDEAGIDETSVVAGPPTSPVVVSSNLSGNYDGGANIFGIQLQWPL